MARELRLPAPLSSDTEAREILRVLVTGTGPRYLLRPDAFADPAGWGLLLVDLARHAAQAIGQTQGGDPESVLERIRAGFDAEWGAPTGADRPGH